MIRQIIHIDEERCNGCGECVYECHTGAIQEKNGAYLIIPDNCVDCEACMDFCPEEAIVKL